MTIKWVAGKKIEYATGDTLPTTNVEEGTEAKNITTGLESTFISGVWTTDPGGAADLDDLTSVDLTTDTPDNNDVLTFTTTGNKWVPAPPPGAGGGEANTVTNIGGGIELIKSKVGIDIPARTFLEGSGIDLTQNTNDITVAVAGIGDSNISIHTSTKISITAKGQLPSDAVYTGDTQTLSSKTLTSPTINSGTLSGTFTLPSAATTGITFQKPSSGASGAEKFATFSIVGASTDELTLENGTGTQDQFVPTWIFTQSSDAGKSTGGILARCDVARDTGSIPLFRIDGRQSSAAISTRPILGITTFAQTDKFLFYKDRLDMIGSFFHMNEISAPSTPPTGKVALWVDSTSGMLSQKDDAGVVTIFGSGGGGITASSTDTLINKTINPTNNILPYLTSYSYSIYQDGGAVKARNNKTGAVTSNTNIDPLVTTILASGDPDFEVQPGTYNLSAGFTGWNGVLGMHVFMHRGTKIYVPQGYASYVWNISPVSQDYYNILMTGGFYGEAGTPTNDWDFMKIAPTGTASGGVHSNTFRDIYVEKCSRAVYIHTDTDTWANSNNFENWFVNGAEYGVYADHAGTFTLAAVGHNLNRFINFDVQAYPAGGGRPNAIAGFYGIAGQYNMFQNCIAWDFPTATGTPRTMELGTNAYDTIINGGRVTNYNFLDNGTGTVRLDGYAGFYSQKGFTVNKVAQASTAERLFEMKVTDSTDAFTLDNLYSTDGVFAPLFRAVTTSASLTSGSNAMYFQGRIKASNDTGSTPVLVFGAMNHDTNAELANRPMLGILNKFTSEYLFYPTYLDLTGNGLRNAVIHSTVTGIVDANISAHTSTKITITNKALLPSDAVYTGDTQTLTAKTIQGLKTNVNAKTATYTAALTDDYIPCAPAANMTINLPAASTATGKRFKIQKTDNSAFTVTIDGASSETINGALTYVLNTQYQVVELECDGAAWFTTGYSISREGTAQGNGNATTYNIPHGLGVTPSYYHAICTAPSGISAYTQSVDSTNITVVFSSATPAGTNNVKFSWRAVI